jgi:hypothetical protein
MEFQAASRVSLRVLLTVLAAVVVCAADASGMAVGDGEPGRTRLLAYYILVQRLVLGAGGDRLSAPWSLFER